MKSLYHKELTCISIFLLCTSCGAGSTTVISTCNSPTFTNLTAESLITSWGNGLQTYNLANNPDIYVSAGNFTMKYYTTDAILQPTLSPVQREGTQEIYDYFTEFLAKNPVMSTNFESNTAEALGCGYGVYAGYYNFVVYPGTPQESVSQARFTFLYQYMPESFSSSFIVESGPNNGSTISTINTPGWYVSLQQSSLLPSDH